MKRKISLSLLLIVVFTVSLVAHLPARLAVNYLPASMGVRLAGVDGTVWQGTAKQVSWQNKPMGRLSWEVHLLQLFLGKADVSVELRGGVNGLDGKGHVGVSFGGPYATDFILSAPAEMVLRNVPAPIPVTATGSVNLVVKRYEFASPWCKELDGRLNWVNGAVSSPVGDISAGDAMANLSCNAGSLSVRGDSKSASLTSNFSLELAPDQSYKVDGWFIPGSEFPNQLRQQLSWLGQPDSNGRYPLKFNG
ncbi:type II secretion system protein N [Veronia pacifica]|uniref:Type II secretion system protein N n=1 Tax=Veronia pacifica TaxID=1080227 RepID=A0A1C3EJQ1_9GAMM|nr:type II secretion system protein N [Veronia pacifica]ODA33467.1 hypothetical protein A8L45_10495 [Veronia pacifica]